MSDLDWTLEATAFFETLVLDALRNEPAGLTAPEIADTTRQQVITILLCLRPMVAEGLIIDSGERRIPPGCTRRFIVWRRR
jgi:DNA-binding IclR family transcriptional regulator